MKNKRYTRSGRLLMAAVILFPLAIFILLLFFTAGYFLLKNPGPSSATQSTPEVGSPSLTNSNPSPAVEGSTSTAYAQDATISAPQPSLTTGTYSSIHTLPVPTTTNIDLEQLLASLSPEQKIGQMIMTGISGSTLTSSDLTLIRQYQFGSIVYFAENTQNAEQTAALSRQLQEVAAQSGPGIPLLIAVDHEGGTVFRFQEDLTHFPNLMALGATASPVLATQAGFANAQELLSVGVNTDLSPVLDVNDQPLNPVIGVRAMSGFPELTAQLGVAYIRGLQDGGVIAAAKHYPGHGSTTIDSHLALPIVEKSKELVYAHELVPFRAAVDAGVGIVMVGHIGFPQLDPSGRPASLSTVFIEDILRQEMNFTGVVMTDALSMGAVQNEYNLENAAVLSVLAGNDLLAYTDIEAAVSANNFLLSAVRSGRISEVRIDEAVRRVLQLKQRFGLFEEVTAETTFDQQSHMALANEIALSAITLQGTANAPIISTTRVLLLTPDRLSVGTTIGDGLSLLGEQIAARGVQVDEWIYPVADPAGTRAMQLQALQAANNFPLVVVVTWDAVLYAGAWGNRAQVEMVRAMQESNLPLILIAASSPFDLSLIRPGQFGLASYGGLDYQIRALADALLSEELPTGTLPVPLNDR